MNNSIIYFLSKIKTAQMFHFQISDDFLIIIQLALQSIIEGKSSIQSKTFFHINENGEIS